ncbi:MAG: recombination protein RecA [Bradymonadia bacterium]|jgi:recombination protein RecA
MSIVQSLLQFNTAVEAPSKREPAPADLRPTLPASLAFDDIEAARASSSFTDPAPEHTDAPANITARGLTTTISHGVPSLLARPCSAAHALEAVRGACEARGVAAPQAGSVLDVARTSSRWTFDGLRGSVVELSSGSALTASMEIVLQAQESGEPVAWVSATSSHFCPDDVANQGIDLTALAVVRVPQVFAAVRAAELLLRSGGFGAVVVDLGVSTCIPDSAVGKLVKLSQRFDAAVICVVGGRSAQTLGSLVSVRVEVDRLRTNSGQYRCRVRSTKDKRHGAGWQTEEVYHGPPGLR